MAYTCQRFGLGLLLVAGVWTNAVREMKQDERKDKNTDQNSYGIAKPCNPNENDVKLTWTPKEIKLDQILKISANWTLNADLSVAYGEYKLFTKATKDSIETEAGYAKSFTCQELLAVLRSPDISTTIKSTNKCPIKKGETIQATFSFGAFSNTPFGYQRVNVLVTSKPGGGHVYACFNIATYIQEPDW